MLCAFFIGHATSGVEFIAALTCGHIFGGCYGHTTSLGPLTGKGYSDTSIYHALLRFLQTVPVMHNVTRYLRYAVPGMVCSSLCPAVSLLYFYNAYYYEVFARPFATTNFKRLAENRHTLWTRSCQCMFIALTIHFHDSTFSIVVPHLTHTLSGC